MAAADLMHLPHCLTNELTAVWVAERPRFGCVRPPGGRGATISSRIFNYEGLTWMVLFKAFRHSSTFQLHIFDENVAYTEIYYYQVSTQSYDAHYFSIVERRNPWPTKPAALKHPLYPQIERMQMRDDKVFHGIKIGEEKFAKITISWGMLLVGTSKLNCTCHLSARWI